MPEGEVKVDDAKITPPSRAEMKVRACPNACLLGCILCWNGYETLKRSVMKQVGNFNEQRPSTYSGMVTKMAEKGTHLLCI